MKNIFKLIPFISLLFFFSSLLAQTWSPIKRLTWTSGGSSCPDLASDINDNIHMVWMEDTLVQTELFFKKSTDGGATWTASKRITWANSPFPYFGHSYHPEMEIDSNNIIHLVWYKKLSGTRKEIFYKKSTDSGETWTNANRLTWSKATTPSITIDSNLIIHVVWSGYSSSPSEIFYKKSTDGGASWSAVKRLSWDLWGSELPELVVDTNDNLHVVWVNEYIEQNREILYKKSTDGGTNWTTAIRLTWTPKAAWEPAIESDQSGHIHLTWVEGYNGGSIHYKRSSDSGLTWINRSITWTNNSFMPKLAIDSMSYVHIVWQYLYSNFYIEYKNSTDNGVNWSPKNRIVWTPGESKHPAIAVDSNDNIHVVWGDTSYGNSEIYYKKEFSEFSVLLNKLQ